ncbi:hypothetical protein [Streptomyces mirabilis]|uniref:hypothetical protein n=1 Tax=Streptomyces mirabilis TaxID=68239 RepID=UPI00380F4A45
MVAVPAGSCFGPGLIQRRRFIRLIPHARSAVRSPALERTHAFMGSLIQDLAINVVSGVLVSLAGLVVQRLRRLRIRRRDELTSAADTNINE